MTLGSIIVAVALVAAPPERAGPPPVSDDPTVQRLADDAVGDFQRGDYERAAGRLRSALRREPENPALLYGLAQALRGLDRCPEAIALYDRFLATGPSPAQREEALAARVKCGAPPWVEPEPSEPSISPEPEPEPEPAPELAPALPPAPPVRVGAALTGAGGGLVLGGSTMVGVAFGLGRRAETAPTQQQYLEQSTRARRLAVAGWIVLGAGIGTLVTGVVRWAIERRRRSGSSRTPAPDHADPPALR